MSLGTGALKVSGVPVNFYFSIVFGYGNVANEFKTKERQKLTETKN